MSGWRDNYADQNLRMAQKMLEQQGEINDLKAELGRQRPVIEAARAWRGQRNLDYRPGEINPHLLTAHHEDLDLARTVDALDGATSEATA